jgi:hypothetical protein
MFRASCASRARPSARCNGISELVWCPVGVPSLLLSSRNYPGNRWITISLEPLVSELSSVTLTPAVPSVSCARRSDDTDARREALRCFGRSARSAQESDRSALICWKRLPMLLWAPRLGARKQGLLAARFQVGGLSQGRRATGAPRHNGDSCRGIPQVGRGTKIEQR